MVDVKNPDASEKLSEETAGEENTMDGNTKAKVANATASARARVSEATAGAKRKLNEAGDSMRSAASQAKAKYGSVRDKVSSTDYRAAASDLRGYVQQHPGKAIIIAASVGFLVGLILRSSEE